MQHRLDSLLSIALVSLLAAATLLCATGLASAAEGCIEKPTPEVKQGHWYYNTERLHQRRCWFFKPSEATVTPSASPDRTAAPNANYEEPWLHLFGTGSAQSISSEPRQNSMSSPSAESSQNSISSFSSEPPHSGSITKTASPRRSLTHKSAKQEQPQLAPPPMTTGFVGTERRDQLPLQSTAEKDEKQEPQLTDAERQALFDEFLNWYRDRAIFGQP
jgi:hypothetical protein